MPNSVPIVCVRETQRDREAERQRKRDRESVCERERQRDRERQRKSVCVRERDRDRERQGKRERECVCERERDRDRERTPRRSTVGLECRGWILTFGVLGVGFRGGLVFKAHRLVYHSTLGWRVIKKKRRFRV